MGVGEGVSLGVGDERRVAVGRGGGGVKSQDANSEATSAKVAITQPALPMKLNGTTTGLICLFQFRDNRGNNTDS